MSGPTKDYNIGNCSFFAKHAALRKKSKNCSARNQDNVSWCCDMSIRGLLFWCASTINKKTKRGGLVQSGPHHHHWKLTYSRHDIDENCRVGVKTTKTRYEQPSLECCKIYFKFMYIVYIVRSVTLLYRTSLYYWNTASNLCYCRSSVYDRQRTYETFEVELTTVWKDCPRFRGTD